MRCQRLVFLVVAGSALATIFGTVQGIVHNPSHRSIYGAEVTFRAVSTDYKQSAHTSEDGQFEFRTVPAGAYRITIACPGFAAGEQNLTVVAGTVPVSISRPARISASGCRCPSPR